MNRRTFLGSLAGAALAPRKPNIVVVLADDMGFSDIGCYGGEVETPVLDGLARRGVRFTRGYNSARCCPSRAALLTGLYSHQAGVGRMVEDLKKPAYQGRLNDRCLTIAEALKASGYRTLLSGKWHVGENRPHWPVDRGFDRSFSLISGASNYYSLDPGRRMALDDKPVELDRYITDAFTDHAIEFLKEQPKQKPFFLYLPYTAPHWPLHALESEIKKYRAVYRAGWDVIRARRHKRQIEMGIVDPRWKAGPRDQRVPAWTDAPNQEWEAERMAVYAAQIDRMDQGLGRVLAQIRAMGEEDNTLVLFMADNGGCAELIEPNFRNLDGKVKTVGGRTVRYGNVPSIAPGPADTFQSYGIGWANASNTPFRLYKSFVHEGGIATPLIAHWPAGLGTQGRITHEVAHLIDVMPTALEAAGAKFPSDGKLTPLEGRSLLPACRGRKQPPRSLFWEHIGSRAARHGDWKLVSAKEGPWELYNLAHDRTELQDRAASEPQRVAELTRQYENWATRCGVLPLKELRGSGTKD